MLKSAFSEWATSTICPAPRAATWRQSPEPLGRPAPGTSTVDPALISKRVPAVFALRPGAIIRDLELKRPIYRDTAAYGHFGRSLPHFTWEHASRLDDFKAAVGL